MHSVFFPLSPASFEFINNAINRTTVWGALSSVLIRESARYWRAGRREYANGISLRVRWSNRKKLNFQYCSIRQSKRANFSFARGRKIRVVCPCACHRLRNDRREKEMETMRRKIEELDDWRGRELNELQGHNVVRHDSVVHTLCLGRNTCDAALVESFFVEPFLRWLGGRRGFVRDT